MKLSTLDIFFFKNLFLNAAIVDSNTHCSKINFEHTCPNEKKDSGAQPFSFQFVWKIGDNFFYFIYLFISDLLIWIIEINETSAHFNLYLFYFIIS